MMLALYIARVTSGWAPPVQENKEPYEYIWDT